MRPANCRSLENEFSLNRSQLFPSAGRKACDFVFADSHPNEAQGRMADGGGHAPHLAVFAFNQPQSNPASRDSFSEPDRRIARPQVRLWNQNPGAAMPG